MEQYIEYAIEKNDIKFFQKIQSITDTNIIKTICSIVLISCKNMDILIIMVDWFHLMLDKDLLWYQIWLSCNRDLIKYYMKYNPVTLKENYLPMMFNYFDRELAYQIILSDSDLLWILDQIKSNKCRLEMSCTLKFHIYIMLRLKTDKIGQTTYIHYRIIDLLLFKRKTITTDTCDFFIKNHLSSFIAMLVFLGDYKYINVERRFHNITFYLPCMMPDHINGWIQVSGSKIILLMKLLKESRTTIYRILLKYPNSTICKMIYRSNVSLFNKLDIESKIVKKISDLYPDSFLRPYIMLHPETDCITLCNKTNSYQISTYLLNDTFFEGCLHFINSKEIYLPISDSCLFLIYNIFTKKAVYGTKILNNYGFEHFISPNIWLTDSDIEYFAINEPLPMIIDNEYKYIPNTVYFKKLLKLFSITTPVNCINCSNSFILSLIEEKN